MSIVDEHARDHPELFDPALAPVLFWGQAHPQWRDLSNFAASQIIMTHQGRAATYPTVEHYFQACKTQNSDDHEWVRGAASAADAKHRGSRDGVGGRAIVLRDDWEDEKFAVMCRALRAKFAIPHFQAVLLATGRRYIAEDSPYDGEWGWCSPGGGHDGKNLLGLALMLVRAELQAAR